MARIKTYIQDDNITNKDIVLGSDGDQNNKTKNYTVQGLKTFITQDFEASEQNNLIKSFTLPSIDNPSASITVLEDAAILINNLSPSLTISADEIYFFKLKRGNRFYVLALKDLGKGSYGANETPITKDNIQVISEKALVVENITQDSTTDVFSLGEIQPLNISEAVNNINPPIEIQPLSEGFTVFTITENGVVKSYLFQGDSGLTGFGEQQTDLADFNLVDQTGFETGDPIPEYLLELVDDNLILSKDNVEVSNIDLSKYLDDTNLPRIISGSYNPSTSTITLTRDDNTTIDISGISSGSSGGGSVYDLELTGNSLNILEDGVIKTSIDLSVLVSDKQDILLEGAFVDGDKTKLDNIESGAEVNDVNSVNTKIGDVVLDADDIDDTSTNNKFTSQTDIDRLANTSGTNTGDQDISGISTNASDITDLQNNKVDKKTDKPVASGTYTLIPSDVDKHLMITAPCTFLVPNSLASDLEFQGEQVGGDDTDVITFVAESGGTLNVTAAFQNKTDNEFSVFGIRTHGSDVATLYGTLKLAE